MLGLLRVQNIFARLAGLAAEGCALWQSPGHAVEYIVLQWLDVLLEVSELNRRTSCMLRLRPAEKLGMPERMLCSWTGMSDAKVISHATAAMYPLSVLKVGSFV